MAGFTLDNYGRRARVLPMFIALFPVATVLSAWTPGIMSLASGAGGAAVLAGASFFLAQLARNAGKRREEALWKSWGGSPTVQFLRHRDSAFNQHQRARCHAVLQQLGNHVPTQNDERDDPAAADAHFAACTRDLISRTRDQERFPLVFKENVNYGFWRNLWGLKPLGLTLSLVALVLCGARLWLSWRASGEIPEPAVAGAAADVALILCWTLWVSPAAVRIPAVAYAERLLEACTELEQGTRKP